MNKFHGFDFAVGSLTGFRRWAVDPLGRLTGVNYRTVWTPGENVATCEGARVHGEDCTRTPQALTVSYPGASSIAYFTGTAGGLKGTFTGWRPATTCSCPPRNPRALHDPDTCGCGFWAYTGSGDEHGGVVSGVVKGYGRTVIGTRGFRCEKAEIVALCLPAPRRGFRNPRFNLWLNVGLGLLNALYATGNFLTGEWIVASFQVALAVLMAVGVGWNLHLIRNQTADPYARLRANYPDIPVYPAIRKMLAKHPLSPSVLPTPDNDPEFWSRP